MSLTNESFDNTILSMNETFIDDENLHDIANPAKIRPTLTAKSFQQNQPPQQPSLSQQTTVAQSQPQVQKQPQQQQQQQQPPLPLPQQPLQQQQQQQTSRTPNHVKFNNINNNMDYDEEEFDDEEGDEYDKEGDNESASVLSQITA